MNVTESIFLSCSHEKRFLFVRQESIAYNDTFCMHHVCYNFFMLRNSIVDSGHQRIFRPLINTHTRKLCVYVYLSVFQEAKKEKDPPAFKRSLGMKTIYI